MWDRLFRLFREQNIAENSTEDQTPEVETQDVQDNPTGKSTHIGYDYLKGLDGNNEDNNKHLRRFINLNKLLRGNFNGKVEASYADAKSNIRGEDSE